MSTAEMTPLQKSIKVMDLIGGAFLDSSALPTDGLEVTVSALKEEDVENPRTFKKEKKKILYFEEFQHGLVLGAKCNRKKLIERLGMKDWKGKKLVIYRDPDVKFGKRVVGAIRIK